MPWYCILCLHEFPKEQRKRFFDHVVEHLMAQGYYREELGEMPEAIEACTEPVQRFLREHPGLFRER